MPSSSSSSGSSSSGLKCFESTSGGTSCGGLSGDIDLMNNGYWYHPNKSSGSQDFDWTEVAGPPKIWRVKVQNEPNHQPLPFPPATTKRSLYDLATHCCFSDFKLSLKFRCPNLRSDWNYNKGTGGNLSRGTQVTQQSDCPGSGNCCNSPIWGIHNWGNSGVYIHNSYEVQIFDSYNGGSTTVPGSGSPTHIMSISGSLCTIFTGEICGALYKRTPPASNPVFQAQNSGTTWPRQPDANADWNDMVIEFMSPRWNASGAKVKLATFKVWLNEALIHDRASLTTKTGRQNEGASGRITDTKYNAPEVGWKKAIGPIVLQEHDNQVEFKDIRILTTFSPANDWQREP